MGEYVMGGAPDDQAVQAFLATVEVGDLRGGTVTDVTRRCGAAVVLDGFAGRPLGTVGPLDMSWCRPSAEVVEVGRRITGEVVGVDPEQGRVRLSMAATENPKLWAFLKRIDRGEVLSGVVASIERFGVFVALDDGPAHPVFPGVGFISVAELSWQRYEVVTDVVQVGQRVSCEFLQFDTWNGEARLSLKAMGPDPFRTFADRTQAGRTLAGTVTKLVPFGAFVRIADGIEGLVPLAELAWTAVEAPEDVVRVGDRVAVVVTELDVERRRVTLSRRRATPTPG
ncbi:S1 RNA-binding domain-containing protein [Streptomyces sp. NPDC059466]|uniref:S1 RNA-binding domain-containing protein n=1 Tax=unclassified Streptomyces TaxID=2593676 RepID=UPI0036BE2AE3